MVNDPFPVTGAPGFLAVSDTLTVNGILSPACAPAVVESVNTEFADES